MTQDRPADKPLILLLRKIESVLLKIQDNPSVSAEELEPMLLDILRFIKSNNTCKPLFVSAFIKMLRGEIRSPHEVIEFCMRELQWPEILDEINDLLTKRKDPRSISVLEELARVYLPDWEDTDMYAYYRDSSSD